SLTVEFFVISSHVTQHFWRFISFTKVRILIAKRNILSYTGLIDVTAWTTTEWRETNTHDHRHICFSSSRYNGVFQATNCFVTESQHHAVNDFLSIKFTFFRSCNRGHQLVGSRINHFGFFAFTVKFILVETNVILLTQTLIFVHHLDRAFVVRLHTIRETFSHHFCTVNASVDTDHVHQVSRAHRPAEFFHHFVDLLEVSTIFKQQVKCTEVREQYAVDQEARAVIDHDWRFTHFLGQHDCGCNRFVRSFRSTNYFDQWHHVYRVKEVHTHEVFRTLQVFSQTRD